ncbi:MAG: hypothetical protein JST26_03790 [Bacteroidetes bacterium]|nr:hypothetical protein [Bacteroidota bacterium]
MNFHLLDACILLTIQACEKKDNGASLRDIIGFYDYINHDILTWEELNASVLKLKATGQVTLQGQFLRAGAEYHAWWTAQFGAKKRINIAKETQATLGYLNELTVPGTSPVISAIIDPDDFQQALADYINKSN